MQMRMIQPTDATQIELQSTSTLVGQHEPIRGTQSFLATIAECWKTPIIAWDWSYCGAGASEFPRPLRWVGKRTKSFPPFRWPARALLIFP